MLNYAIRKAGVKPFGVTPWGVSINYDAPDAFISEWETENAGSATKTIILPLSANPVDIYVNWGDGNYSHITAFDQVDKTHVYATAGTKTIKIAGTLQGFQFNNGGDKLKLTEISQWGCFNVSVARTFSGCTNLECTAIDAPIISALSSFLMFNNCSSLTNIGDSTGWDVSIMTFTGSMFKGCKDFNQDLSSWDVGLVENMSSMFDDADDFDQDLSAWDISSVENMTDMFDNKTTPLSTANYSAMLIAWEAGTHFIGVMNANFGNATYTGAAAIAARAALVIDGWVITDGGAV